MTAILVAGNCQAQVVAAWLRLMAPSVPVHEIDYGKLIQDGVDLSPPEGDITHVFAAQGGTFDYFNQPGRLPGRPVEVRPYPAVFFSGYHPDTVYPDPDPDPKAVRALSPTGTNHSALAVFGWMKGYTVEDTVKLFNARVFEHLGYFDHFDMARRMLLEHGQSCGIALEEAFPTWLAETPFLHTPNHPKPKMLRALAEGLARQIGIDPALPDGAAVPDPFERLIGWPLYPGLAERFGMQGDYSFRLVRPQGSAEPARRLGLEAYVAESFEIYEQSAGAGLVFGRLADPRYNDVAALTFGERPLRPRSGQAATANPYRNLSDSHFWSRSVARPEPSAVDPTSDVSLRLTPATRIATAGSCFAQHIAANLKRRGYTYMVTDTIRPGDVRAEVYQNASQFSARYGNIYSSRQLIQLFQRAYGEFKPVQDVWLNADGRFIDALRPQIVEGGFLTEEELLDDRERHFAAVRTMFETLEVMVFTLGLTEIWRSKADGLATPVAPGVLVGPEYQEGYEFHNLEVDEVASDLAAFVAALERVNPKAQIILTVSPVPLIATYTDSHVLAATTYSKSVLRVAAEQCARRNGQVHYFPSYEIITAPSSGGLYFESDLRNVKPEGVEHVMGVFFRRYAGEGGSPEAPAGVAPAARSSEEALRGEMRAGTQIICDELLNEGG